MFASEYRRKIRAMWKEMQALYKQHEIRWWNTIISKYPREEKERFY